MNEAGQSFYCEIVLYQIYKHLNNLYFDVWCHSVHKTYLELWFEIGLVLKTNAGKIYFEMTSKPPCFNTKLFDGQQIDSESGLSCLEFMTQDNFSDDVII